MKPPRNHPCPCGSGKKYKKCHLPVEREADRLLKRDLEEAMLKKFRTLEEEFKRSTGVKQHRPPILFGEKCHSSLAIEGMMEAMLTRGSRFYRDKP